VCEAHLPVGSTCVVPPCLHCLLAPPPVAWLCCRLLPHASFPACSPLTTAASHTADRRLALYTYTPSATLPAALAAELLLSLPLNRR
jgi:hypothetical protein